MKCKSKLNQILGAPRCGSGPNWCLEGPPPIHPFDWRTLPSSQSPSLPSLSLPLPPTPLGSFCNAPGRGGPVWCGGMGPRVHGGGGVEGGGLQRDLGPDPHLGALENRKLFEIPLAARNLRKSSTAPSLSRFSIQ